MNFSAHFLGSAGAGMFSGIFALMHTGSMQVAGAAFGAAAVGGVFPDLDTASIPARWFGRLGFVVAGVAFGLGSQLMDVHYLQISAIIGLFALLLLGLKHRGPFHKYWLPVFCFVLAAYGEFSYPEVNLLLACFGLGVIVHLALDFIFIWQLKAWI